MLNGSSGVSGLARTSRDLGVLLWTAKNSPPIFRDAAGRVASPKRYGALTGSAARACRHRARVSIRAWDRYLLVCRARSAGHPVIRIPSRATGSAATAGTVSSCDAARCAPGSAMSTACRDFTRRGRAPGAGGTTTASARIRTRLPQARPSSPPKCTATGVQAAPPDRTPAAGTGHRRTPWPWPWARPVRANDRRGTDRSPPRPRAPGTLCGNAASLLVRPSWSRLPVR